MIRNFFKERKERKEQELKERLLFSEQMRNLRYKMLKIMEDERLYDTTYIVYSSELPNCNFPYVEKFVKAACNAGGLSYGERLYMDGSYAFYIYVKKREDPKYNVGDIYHQKETEFDRPSDLLILGRSYDGKGRYVYATIQAYHPLSISKSEIYWRHLDY